MPDLFYQLSWEIPDARIDALDVDAQYAARYRG